MIQFSGLLGFRASPIFSLSSVEFGVLPMAPRAYWKGFLRLSLVTCPIALFPATSESEKISFNQINRNTGHRTHILDGNNRLLGEVAEQFDLLISKRADLLSINHDHADQFGVPKHRYCDKRPSASEIR